MTDLDSDYMPDIHYSSLAELEISYWWHLSRLNWVKQFINNYCDAPDKLSIIDFGCGTGGFLYSLNKIFKFKNYVGIDASAQAIEFAKKYGDNYKLVEADSINLPPETDLVFLMDVLEHIEDDAGLLKKILTQLKSEGLILLSTPALPFLYSKWDETLGHHRRYMKKSLYQVVSKAGGRIKEIKYGFCYLVPIVLFKRVLFKKNYSTKNCEFPTVSPIMNKLLLCLNSLEISIAKYINFPMGTSVFCLIQKK